MFHFRKFCNNKHGYKDKRVYFNKKHGADGMVRREKTSNQPFRRRPVETLA